MNYIAHINENTQAKQTVDEHLLNTAALCRDYAIAPMKEAAYNIGLLHDIGKYQPSFQKRIAGSKMQVEHSGPGAQAAMEYYGNNNFIRMLSAYCIAGHHGGLPNGGNPNDTEDMNTLYARLQRSFEDYSLWQQEVKLQKFPDTKLVLNLTQTQTRFANRAEGIACLNEKFAFWTKYCFSCLVDADCTDTADFCGTNYNKRLVSDFSACLAQVNDKLNGFQPVTPLQKARSKIQQQVYDNKADADIYLMNMPTGSGKTLCSVKFALEKAIRLQKRHIIYIIPFNSIIDQTALEFEAIFGKHAEILRHQSTFTYEKTADDEDYKVYAMYAAENWNADFIITTAVQFFESLASNKRQKLHKMHNMADSILIFDEAHMLPINYLAPCLQAIVFITKYLNSKAVLLTATMPDYQGLIERCVLDKAAVVNLVQGKKDFAAFKKCRYQFIGNQSHEQLLMRAAAYPSSLIIVNKRSTARELYKLAAGKKYHLSTYMTAVDRQRVIKEIKDELQKLAADYPNQQQIPDDRKIIVIATSLIEAGVDLDFYTVFRELNGLDNILQAGGRCNREGKRPMADVYIFIAADNKTRPENIRANITKGVINDYQEIDSPEAIAAYYKALFSINEKEISQNFISNMASGPFSLPFADYAARFKFIEDKTVALAIDRDASSSELIAALRSNGKTNMRELQKYTCTIYKYELNYLLEQGAVSDYGSGIYCLTNSDYYNENTGIELEGHDYYFEEGCCTL